jgi:hypothetical protein
MVPAYKSTPSTIFIPHTNRSTLRPLGKMGRGFAILRLKLLAISLTRSGIDLAKKEVEK